MTRRLLQFLLAALALQSRAADLNFGGGARADLALYTPASGTWNINVDGTNVVTRQFGWAEATPAPADFDGDGIADLCVYHAAAGNWYVRSSINGSVQTVNWGWAETLAVPASEAASRAEVSSPPTRVAALRPSAAWLQTSAEGCAGDETPPVATEPSTP